MKKVNPKIFSKSQTDLAGTINVDVNIAFKEELLKSPKDLEDAKHLRIVYSEKVNEEEINNVKELIKKLRL